MMNCTEKISIIVPVYNLELLLERTIRSIQEQTYKNIEIVIVDDGSTDNSKKIISALAKSDSRIVPVYKENGGVTRARLAGVSVATGEWIGFVDGDDYVENTMFEKLLNNALSYKADISHCGYKMIFEDGRENYFYNTGKVVIQNKIEGLIDLLKGEFIEPGLCNKLFHKSLFFKLLNEDIMDLSIKQYEDLLMNYYLFNESSKNIYQDICCYHYIVRQQSSSRKDNKEVLDPIKVREIILNDCETDLRTIAEKTYLEACVAIYNGIKESPKNVYKTAIRKKILINKKKINIIRKQSKIMALMICHCPYGYELLYKIYRKYFQVKKYE